MQRRLPPLNSLKAFEAAARRGSFKEAAEELHVTHGAVSRHVRLLEDWLGRPLFRRLNRRVVPTGTGKAYVAEIGAALDRIALATSHHLARSRTRLLRVSATATLTLRWLIPRLSSFQLENPGIEVRLTTSNEPIETLDEPLDVIVRRGTDEVAGYSIVWSMPEYRMPVCSPRLLREVPLRCVKDLENHTLLHPTSRPTVWSDWLKAAGVPDLTPRRSLVLEHSYQTFQAALDGVGVATASLALITDDVAAGRLVMPFSGPKLPAEGYSAYVPKTKVADPAVITFRDWLQRITAAEPRTKPVSVRRRSGMRFRRSAIWETAV
jgi:LysR family transcriptional regulator, glycine cleavage system transcriptional activator